MGPMKSPTGSSFCRQHAFVKDAIVALAFTPNRRKLFCYAELKYEKAKIFARHMKTKSAQKGGEMMKRCYA